MSESETVMIDESHVVEPEGDWTPAFETKKFVLQNLLDKAASTLPTRDVQPVLKNFYIEATQGRLRVVSTDLELSVVASTEMVSVQREGASVFPGRRLLDIVKEAEDDVLSVDVTKDGAHLEVQRTTWDLKLKDPFPYPKLPELDEVEFHDVSRSKFLAAIGAVRYAAGKETQRPSMMLIDISGGRMRASDGQRFQQAVIDGWPEGFDIQIPIRAVDDLVRLLRTEDSTAVLQIGESPRHLVFVLNTDMFLAAYATAEFPDVDQLLLKPALANKHKLSLDREELIAAIKRVRVTADPETSAVRMELRKDKVVLSAEDKFHNSSEETLDAAWSGKVRTMAFNHSYLLDMLAMTDVRSCEFRLGDDSPTRPQPVLLEDQDNQSLGVLNQIRPDFLS